MRFKRSLQILLCCLPLCACSAISGGVDFPFTNDENLPTFCRNGDLYPLKDTELPYKQTVKTIDLEGIAERFSFDEPVFLFLYQEGCHACQTIHSGFNQFLLDSNIDCFAFEETSLAEDIRALKKEYPEMKDVIQLATPYAYLLLPDGNAIDTELLENINVPSTYENRIKSMINLSLVYTFTKESALTSFLGKTSSLVYFYDDDAGLINFENIIVKEYGAKKIGKPIASVDLRNMSEEDLLKIESTFGSNAANLVFYSGKDGSISEGETIEKASLEEGLLTKYYSKVMMS